MVTPSTRLPQFLQALVDADESLQRHILERVSAYVAHHGSTAAVSDSPSSTAPLDAVPLWSRPEGFPPLPHTAHARSLTASEQRQPWEPVEMVLMLDVMEVAHRSPSLCQALFFNPTAVIEASASQAVAAWMSCYVASFTEDRPAKEDALAAFCVLGQPRSLPWPWLWCAAMLHRQLVFQVRVLLFRIPSFYAIVTSAAGELAPCNRLPGAHPVSPVIEDSSVLHSGEPNFCTEQSSCILPTPAEVETLPSARSSSAHSLCCTYPSDRFLETSHTVNVIGVVHQVFYEGHSAASPAPWVTLLLLPLAASRPRSAFPKHVKEPPRRREVDLGILSLPQRTAVAVIGGVVVVRGHTQVAGRRAATRAESAVSLRLGGVAEMPLEEYIVATWAAPAQLSAGMLRTNDFLWPSDNSANSVPGEATETSPLATVVVLDHPAPEPAITLPHCPTSAAAVAELGYSKHRDEASLPLTPAEEEAAARAALMCWEGARLALGIESSGHGSDKEEATRVTHFFSVSLDFLVACQLALVSAQMADGVVVLAVDEAAPESLVTRLTRRLDSVAPSATLEVPSSILSCAKPSFFLPSYHTKRVPVPPVSRANTPASAVTAVLGTQMGPPAARQAQHRRLRAERTVSALPPPSYPEILQGGALTHANSRTLVLQRIEATSAPTLKLLQEVLCDEPGDAGDLEVTTRGSMESENALDLCFSSSSYTEGQRQKQIASASSTNPGAATRRLVRREGGQAVKYCATRSALCTVRQGSSLTQKSHLVEFAERCDVVVRPAYDTFRQKAALQGSTVPAFCDLFHSRGEAWLELMGAALMLPLRRAVDNGPSPKPISMETSHARISGPTVSEACSQLLSTYFIAAKALCVEGADASMMKTLVKLTVAHAEWRTRLTIALQQRAGDPSTAFYPSCGATALIDAVVAVGLCDATLHFFTAKTPLGECIFRILESEGWPVLASDYCSVQLPQHLESNARGTHEGTSLQGEPVEPPDWLRLYTEVEHRTRLSPAFMPTTAPQPAAFSILQLVRDMQGHLERTVQQSYRAGSSVEGST
ncbi:hypothetical protein JKF63_02054 [Porcisia hertigi]|uniref:Uncharacterized protein n=1 Tax=Porcisia hertigi TaxID=2761500 RepID=A0A836HYT1_9TRYP|nr:hypothetical protein JKF63_02054 [Porcisia hertigi]